MKGVFWVAEPSKNTLMWRECNDNEHQPLFATRRYLLANAIRNPSCTLYHVYLSPNKFVYKRTNR
jgi:hypothetical protein